MTRLDKFDSGFVEKAMQELLSLLTMEQRERFLSAMRVERYKKNELIYREGESPDHLLCLLSGKVKIFRDGFSGRVLINRVLRPVQYFGYRASLAGEPYVTAAAAFEESIISLVPMRLISEIMSQNQKFCQFFIKALAVDLGVADKRIVSLTQKHVRGRLAETLLSLLDIYGVDIDGQTLDLNISREDLANLSNMTTSNAIRTLMSFAEERLVEVHGRCIKLLNLKDLQIISANG